MKAFRQPKHRVSVRRLPCLRVALLFPFKHPVRRVCRFPGRFTASGELVETGLYDTASEQFAIRSGRRKLSGDVSFRGSGGLNWFRACGLRTPFYVGGVPYTVRKSEGTTSFGYKGGQIYSGFSVNNGSRGSRLAARPGGLVLKALGSNTTTLPQS